MLVEVDGRRADVHGLVDGGRLFHRRGDHRHGHLEEQDGDGERNQQAAVMSQPGEEPRTSGRGRRRGDSGTGKHILRSLAAGRASGVGGSPGVENRVPVARHRPPRGDADRAGAGVIRSRAMALLSHQLPPRGVRYRFRSRTDRPFAV
ncbi:hypothetical protein GCM10009540_41480 [Streptomyces turgidiscabies]